MEEPRRPGCDSWLIEIILLSSVAEFFLTFGATFGTTPALDGDDLVEQWLRDLVDARTGAQEEAGAITIVDSKDTTVVLHTPLPDGALAGLPLIDWDRVAGHRLEWDSVNDKWDGAR